MPGVRPWTVSLTSWLAWVPPDLLVTTVPPDRTVTTYEVVVADENLNCRVDSPIRPMSMRCANSAGSSSGRVVVVVVVVDDVVVVAGVVVAGDVVAGDVVVVDGPLVDGAVVDEVPMVVVVGWSVPGCSWVGCPASASAAVGSSLGFAAMDAADPMSTETLSSWLAPAPATSTVTCSSAPVWPTSTRSRPELDG